MNKGVTIFWACLITLATVRVISIDDTHRPLIDGCIGKKVVGIGQIISNPEHKDAGQIMVVEVSSMYIAHPESESTYIDGFDASMGGQNINSSLDCGKDYRLRIKTDSYPMFGYGDYISFVGNMSEPYNFRSDDGRVFDYRNFLAKEDIYFEIKSARVRIYSQAHNSIKKVLFSIRSRFMNNIKVAIPDPHAGLATGLLVGDKDSLSSDLLEKFRVVGLIHVIVLSGYHISMVAVIIRRLFSWLPRDISIIIAALFIILFSIMVGLGASVLRAVTMSSLALIADSMRQDYNASRALFFVGFIMIIINPMLLLYDPSFQLSFLATLGLVLYAKPIQDRLTFITEFAGLRSVVTASISAQILISPMTLYMMGTFSISGLLVNILVLPTIPITMLVSLLVGMIGSVSDIFAQYVGYVAYFALEYTIAVVEYFSGFSWSYIKIPPFSIWYLGAIYLLIGIVHLVLWTIKKREMVAHLPQK